MTLRTTRLTLLALMLGIMSTLTATIDYRALRGTAIQPYISTMVQEKIIGYRDYPYLFVCEGAPENESTDYYLASAQTIMIGAFDNEELVGFIVGLPLKDYNVSTCGTVEKEEYPAAVAFGSLPLSIDNFYYISEMMVRKEYDRDTIAQELYRNLEDELSTAHFSYSYLCCIVLELPTDHPMRPQDPTLRWLEKEGAGLTEAGFIRTPELITYAWPTLQPDGLVKLQAHPMNFWLKKLSGVS